MKLISWNVNGLRACMGKGFLAFAQAEAPDVLAVQETKMHPEQATVTLPGYHQYWHSAEKKGYSGTAVFCREEPIAVTYGLGIAQHDTEGRVITLEFPSFYVVTVYTPNAQDKLARLAYRMEWDAAFLAFVQQLDQKKPVILCGDLNVAHKEIDLKNPKSNAKNPGFSPQERQGMTNLLDAGFTDSFRGLYPDRAEAYSWWSYRYNARANNAGWRIDYFIVSNRLMPQVRDSQIYAQVEGSDHCPVGLLLQCI